MSSEVAVYVAVGERNLLAGRLYPHRRRGIESASFGYEDRYLADLDSYALDLALLLVTGREFTGIWGKSRHNLSL